MMPNMAKHIMIIIFFCKYPQQNMYHPMGSECGRGRQREKQEKNEREKKKRDKRKREDWLAIWYFLSSISFVFFFFNFASSAGSHQPKNCIPVNKREGNK